MNGFATTLKVVIFFIILTDLTRVLLSFVWMKCSRIKEVSVLGEGGEARVQAWGCQEPQVNIQGDSSI